MATPHGMARSSAKRRSPCSSTQFVKHRSNVIKRERPLSVPRNLHPLPRRQVVVNLSARFAKLCLKFFHCRSEIDIVLRGMALQILQPPFQFKDRLLKIKRLPFHESVKAVKRLKLQGAEVRHHAHSYSFQHCNSFNSSTQSTIVTGVRLFTSVLSSSRSVAARPRPVGGGGCSRLGCAESDTEYKVYAGAPANRIHFVLAR